MNTDDFSLDNGTARHSLYIFSMRPILNMDALFSDTTGQFVIPMETDPYTTVRIRFRTARNNVDSVQIVFGTEKD